MNVTSNHSATVLARMTIDILTELIPVPCTEHEKLNRLRSLLIEIQAAWFGNSFGSGETFSTPEIWEKMQEAVCLMHQSDDPSKKGIDLKTIASDYPLLEQIFIARHWETNGYVLDDSSFVGCDLIQMHRFSALGILRKVDKLHQSILMQQSKENSDRTIEQRIVDRYPDDIELCKVNNARRELHIPLLWRTPEGILIPEGYESAAEYEKSLGLESYPDEDLAYEIIGKGLVVSE